MSVVVLYLWELAVAIGIFGFGIGTLRLLGIKRAPLALSGTFGISLWIALGGWLNLLHLLKRSVFFTLVGIGVLPAIFELLQARRNATATRAQQPPLSLSAKLLFGAAIALIGTQMLGGMRPLLWNGDDLEGYAALAVKASQMHSIQPDPFSERRVQAGGGGGNFLDTMMLAEGGLPAMPFIDSTFGLFLYALGLWTIGRRWKVPPAAIAFALLCLPFATLMKVNLTIIYLSAAAFFAVLILLSDIEPDESFGAGRILVLGILVGALATTKSPNIVFIVPFLFATALLCKLFAPSTKAIVPIAFSLLVAIAVFLPYSIANKTNAGTYLYPLLGRGIHISAYHLIPTPSQVGTWPQLFVLLTPNLLFLSLSLIVTWKLTRDWTLWPRAAVIAYLFAAFLAAPITAYGLGGEGADRYTAPFVMPALLLSLLIVLATIDGATDTGLRVWRRLGIITLAFAGIYISIFLGYKLRCYRDLKILAYEGVGVFPIHHSNYAKDMFMFAMSPHQIQQALAYGAHIQAALPPGATAISIMQYTYIFDFHRNTIYIADYPGMATPPPGLPINQNLAAQRQFLIDHGVDYIIYDNRIACGTPDWGDFLRQPSLHFGWKTFLRHEAFAHRYRPWTRVELEVTCHESTQMDQIVEHSPQVYNDGRVVVARIN